MSQTSIMLKLRPSVVKDRMSSLYIQFIKDRKVMTITTPHKIYKEEWNSKKSAICMDVSDSDRQKYLSDISLSLRKEMEDLKIRVKQLEDTRDCSLEEIVRLYGRKSNFRMLSSYVDKLKAELQENFQERTSDAYQTVVNNIICFNLGKDISLDQINALLVKRFETYMKKKGNSLNTISFYMRNLRAIYNKAIRERIIDRKTENPFEDVYTSVYKTRKRAVKKEVFNALFNLDLSVDINGIRRKKSKEQADEWKESLNFSRDLFFLSFYLRGISFIDLAYLKKSDVSDDVIVYMRRKTRQKLEIAMTDEIRDIVDRYSKKCKSSDYLLPILHEKDGRKDFLNALRRQNNYLKILSRMIGLEHKLTTYVARHSWASIAWSKGYSVSVISMGLGHDSEKTTRIYLDSFDYSSLHKVNKEIINYTKKAS